MRYPRHCVRRDPLAVVVYNRHALRVTGKVPGIGASMTQPPNLPSTITDEQQTASAETRRINLIWEVTLAFIVSLTFTAAVFVLSRIALIYVLPEITTAQQASANLALFALSNLSSVMIGFIIRHTARQRENGGRK